MLGRGVHDHANVKSNLDGTEEAVPLPELRDEGHVDSVARSRRSSDVAVQSDEMSSKVDPESSFFSSNDEWSRREDKCLVTSGPGQLPRWHEVVQFQEETLDEEMRAGSRRGVR